MPFRFRPPKHPQSVLDALGVRVIDTHLEDVDGLYCPERHIVFVHSGLTARERRATLAHELEHVRRKEGAAPNALAEFNQERRADARAAKRLIKFGALMRAVTTCRTVDEAAEKLHVDAATLETRLEHASIADCALWMSKKWPAGAAAAGLLLVVGLVGGGSTWATSSRPPPDPRLAKPIEYSSPSGGQQSVWVEPAARVAPPIEEPKVGSRRETAKKARSVEPHPTPAPKPTTAPAPPAAVTAPPAVVGSGPKVALHNECYRILTGKPYHVTCNPLKQDLRMIAAPKSPPPRCWLWAPLGQGKNETLVRVPCGLESVSELAKALGQMKGLSLAPGFLAPERLVPEDNLPELPLDAVVVELGSGSD